MIGVEQLKELYLKKLEKTGSFDEAFVKAVWVAYIKGYNVGREEAEQNRPPPVYQD